MLVGNMMHHVGLYSHAAKHYEQVLELFEKESRPEDVDVCIYITFFCLLCVMIVAVIAD